MSAPCPTCFPIDCGNAADTGLYALEGTIYPFVLDCPPGYNCGTATSFNILCCGQLISGQFPPNAGVSQKLAIIQELINQCAVRQSFCGTIPIIPVPPGGPPSNPVIWYYSHPQSCPVKCPDGNSFVFSLPAGAFADLSQALADQNANNYACQQAKLRKMCLGSIPSETCNGSSYSTVIPESGGIAPLTWSIVEGFLPPGITLGISNGLLSGTSTSPGSYPFTVQVTGGDGSFMQKAFTICVVDILPSRSTLSAAIVGQPYVQQFGDASGCAVAPLNFQVIGTLPAGLTLNQTTGLLSGTPTTPGTYMFSIKLQDSAS